MQRVKEEFYISLIFVLKWLALALGILGILYFAISLAYHKSYYDPRMREYELEIAELYEKKVEAKTDLSKLESTLKQIQIQINTLIETKIPAAKESIALHEKKIEALNEDFIDRYNPFNEKSAESQMIYEQRDKAIEHKERLDEQLEDLLMTQAVKAVSKSEMLEKIDQIEIFISIEEHEKEKVGTGSLGVLPWLFGILGLT